MDPFLHWAHVVEQCFGEMAERVKVVFPQLRTDVWLIRPIDTYPLTVLLSFWSGVSSDDEWVVVSAAIWHGRGVFRRDCDILVDNNDVVLEMPCEECRDDVGEPELGQWVARVVSEALEWSVSHEDVIVSLLAERVGTSMNSSSGSNSAK